MTSAATTKPPRTLLAYKAISLVHGLSSSDRRVGACILDHFNHRTGRCDPGIDRMAALLQIHRRTVLRAVDVLGRLGLVFKDRHGGRALQNNYEPNWARFEEIEADWKMRFSAASGRAASLSRNRCQHGPGTSDSNATQTFLLNQSIEPILGGTLVPEARRQRRGLEDGQAGSSVPPRHPERIFHRRAAPSEAATGAAQRRWYADLHSGLATDQQAFGAVIAAIDALMAERATAEEVRRHGGGIEYLVNELARRGVQVREVEPLPGTRVPLPVDGSSHGVSPVAVVSNPGDTAASVEKTRPDDA